MKAKLLVIALILGFCVICRLYAEPQEKNAQANEGKISLDIKGMDIVDVLKMLAGRSGMNLVIGKNVTGKVTLFLKNVDVQDAFEIVVLANDLAYEKKGQIINVMTQRDYEQLYGERYEDKKEAKIVQLKYAKAADLSRAINLLKTNVGKVVVDEATNTIALIDTPQKLKEMESFIKSTDLPLETRIFGLSYAQADKVQAKIQDAVTKGVGSIKIDERTNKIAITDYPNKIEEFEKMLVAFDEKTPQVLIDAQIIEIKPTNKLEMGVDWDFFINKYFQLKTSLPVGIANRLFLGTTSTSPAEPDQFKAILDILHTIGNTKVLSSPRIMVLNNQEASIHVGTRDAYITSTISQATGAPNVTSQTVNFVDTGIKLFVTPTINRDGFITMKIKPEVSSSERRELKSEGQLTEVPIVTTSEAETTVMLKDGVTVIIGGLKKDEKKKTVKKIPVLGDVPWLGNLFKSTSDEVNQTDLVILLTPHIMSGEKSYVAFSEIKPTEGAMVNIVNGEIITQKVSSSSQEQALGLLAYGKQDLSYYQLISNKIQRFAKLNSPADKKGEVNISFNVSVTGNLIEEPVVLNATDPALSDYAIKAVKDASPFPPFPADLNKTQERFKLSLIYGQEGLENVDKLGK